MLYRAVIWDAIHTKMKILKLEKFAYTFSPKLRSTFRPFNLLFPCLCCLLTEKNTHGVKLLLCIPCFQHGIILFPIFFMDDDWRVVMQHQKIVHSKPPSASVAVCKGVDVFKFHMEVCCGGQGVGIINFEAPPEAPPFSPVRPPVPRRFPPCRSHSHGAYRFRDVPQAASAGCHRCSVSAAVGTA